MVVLARLKMSLSKSELRSGMSGCHEWPLCLRGEESMRLKHGSV